MTTVDAKTLHLLFMPLQLRQQFQFNTIESCICEAKLFVRQSQLKVEQRPDQRTSDVFKALAGGDAMTGLLAFYLWQCRRRYQW